MKTRYKILTVTAIVIIGFFTFPPILTSVCDSLGIYDETCPRISGIQVPFVGSVQMWSTAPLLIDILSQDDCNDVCADVDNSKIEAEPESYSEINRKMYDIRTK